MAVEMAFDLFSAAKDVKARAWQQIYIRTGRGQQLHVFCESGGARVT